MNPNNSDGLLSGGTLLSLFSSIAGFFTLDRVYMITAVVGMVIALFGYLDRRSLIRETKKNEAERLKLDRELTQATIDSLKYGKDSPSASKFPEVSEGIQQVLDAAKD